MLSAQHRLARHQRRQEARWTTRPSARRSPRRSTSPTSSTRSTATSSQAADPTGLLPTWDKYIDTAQRDALGFKYDPAKAKPHPRRRRLQEGRRRVLHQQGRLADQAHHHGPDRLVRLGGRPRRHHREPEGRRHQRRGQDRRLQRPRRRPQQTGDFDLVLNNEVQVSATRRGRTTTTCSASRSRMPRARTATTARYANADAWALVQQLDKTPVDDVAGMQAITSKLQKIQLTDMPVIPLWYNGLWSQVSNVVWTDWPSDGRHATSCPATWNGYWQMGAVKMLTETQAGHRRSSRRSRPAPPLPRSARGRGSLPERRATRRPRATLLRAQALHLRC